MRASPGIDRGRGVDHDGTMGLEIERKFRVTGDEWRKGEGALFRQGYLNSDPERTVRVRIEGERAVLTVKGITEGVRRLEFEYEIPVPDAAHLLDALCEKPLIEKRRYRVAVGNHTWEVDDFLGENAGLVVAEIELGTEDEPFEQPPWLGEEVSHDPRFYNVNLVSHPYAAWPESST